MLPEIKLVVQLQPLSELETVVRVSQETDLNKAFAQKVVINLFNYMSSFNQISEQQSQQQGVMVVPTNTLSKWYDRFLKKYELDPNFVFKSTE